MIENYVHFVENHRTLEMNNQSPTPLQFQDSAMSGDIHHTVINNDVEAVTNAVIMALDKLGVVSNESTKEVPVEHCSRNSTS